MKKIFMKADVQFDIAKFSVLLQCSYFNSVQFQYATYPSRIFRAIWREF